MGEDSGIQLGRGILFSQEAEPASTTKRPSFLCFPFPGDMARGWISLGSWCSQCVPYGSQHVPNKFHPQNSHWFLEMFPLWPHFIPYPLPKALLIQLWQNFLFVFVFDILAKFCTEKICCFAHVLSCNCLSFVHMAPF